MKIVYNNSDFELPIVILNASKLPVQPSSISGDIDIKVYTSSVANGLTYAKSDIVDGKIYVESTDASTLAPGVLYYNYTYSVVNQSFPDGYQTISNMIQTNYYLSTNRQETGVIPTSTSELVNDADFATKQWVTTTAYTKSQVNQIASAKQGKLTAGTGIVISNNNVISTNLNGNPFIALPGTSLPSTGIQEHMVYLLRNTIDSSSLSDPIYDEYIYENGSWNHVGKFQIDTTILSSFDTRLDDLENQNVFLEQDEYDALELTGEVDPDKIYYTYE